MKLIAETAWHHQGDFNFFSSLVKAISKNSLADVLKLHLTIDLQEYMSDNHPSFEQLSSYLFTKSQWKDIIEIGIGKNKELMLLFNDTSAIEFGMQYNPKYVEIHSVCLNDLRLLDALRAHLLKETYVIFGIGGSSLYEIESAINRVQTKKIILMFGFQNYPTKYADVNFAKMRKIMNLFPEFKFGYADHTAWNEPNNILITLFGAALGMDFIEKHVTISYGQERLDWSSAISISMLNSLKEKLNLLKECNGNGMLALSKCEQDYSICGPMKKAAILIRNVYKGERFNHDAVVFKRTKHLTDLNQVDVIQSKDKIFSSNIVEGTVLMHRHFLNESEKK